LAISDSTPSDSLERRALLVSSSNSTSKPSSSKSKIECLISITKKVAKFLKIWVKYGEIKNREKNRENYQKYGFFPKIGKSGSPDIRGKK
jgi:hypothetical protein